MSWIIKKIKSTKKGLFLKQILFLHKKNTMQKKRTVLKMSYAISSLPSRVVLKYKFFALFMLLYFFLSISKN